MLKSQPKTNEAVANPAAAVANNKFVHGNNINATAPLE